MAASWRLIIDGPVDGVLNMALDRAAQLAREEGSAPPTLRLYRWARPTVSLGRFQPLEALSPSEVAAAGVDVVRRSTGGRGVLHDDEVTYSLVASLDDGLPRGVAASYRRICGALAGAYRNLGVMAELTANDRVVAESGACYLATTRADLSLGARKLSGSAQVWSGSTVLQHGSFTRSRDTFREARVFGLSAEGRRHLADTAAVLDDVAGVRISDERIVEAAVRAFEAEFGVVLRRGEWTAREAELARDVMHDVRVVFHASPST